MIACEHRRQRRNDSLGHMRGDGVYDGERRGGAQGDFQDTHTAGDQGFGEWQGMGGVVNNQHGQDRVSSSENVIKRHGCHVLRLTE